MGKLCCARLGTRLFVVSVSLIIFVHSVSLSVAGQPRSEYRAFWVDTFNTLLDNHTQVLDVINRAKQAKSNAIFVQVRRRGDSWYLNSLEPRADRRTFTPVNFDPLQDLITEAHRPENGLEVHAFVIVGAVWNRDPRCPLLQPPTGHVFNSNGAFDPVTKNVDPNLDNNWLTRTLLPDTGAHLTTCQTATPNISFNGQRFGAEFWIDLGHPDAARYTNAVMMHLVQNYDIDGLHLDRIRYPEFTASGQTPGNGTNIGYNKTSVNRFNTRFGVSGNPATGDPLWMQWRRDQVTNFVRRLYLDIVNVKPQIKVSGAFIAFGGGPTSESAWNSAEAYWRVYQDWRAWTQEGIIDLAVPMNYKREHLASQAGQFAQWTEWSRNHQYNRAALIGVGNFINPIEGTLRQVRSSLSPSATTGNSARGVVFFSMQTNNSAATNGINPIVNPFAIPPSITGVRTFPEFASGLTTGRSVDGITQYEDPATNPVAIFTVDAQIPTLAWKSAPTKGHVKGFAKRPDTTPLDTATVTIQNIVTNEIRTGATDGGGFYGGVDLDPGQYFIKADLGSERLTSCIVNVTAGNVTTTDLAIENMAPVTTAIVSPAAPNGSNGWYVTDVQLNLAATDNCSGVDRSEYSTDGGTTWQTPVNGSVTFSEEGVTTVLYRSVDRAGNIEAVQNRVLMIDKTAPTITLTADPSRIWPPNGKTVNVSLNGDGADPISGLAAVSYTVTDEYGTPLAIPTRSLSGASSTWLDILGVEASRRGEDIDGRLYRIVATITDVAGNTSSITVDVVVPHDQRR